MRMRLYTVHEKGAGLRVVSDGFDLGAFLVPPVWAIWHGAWATLLLQLGTLVGAGVWSPLGPPVAALGVSLILGFEGAAARRLDLRLRGWRPVGLVEARSAAGAEELWLEGAVA